MTARTPSWPSWGAQVGWPEPPLPGSLQAEEKQLTMAEKTVKDLQLRSQGVAPLPQRRNLPPQPLRVDSICDWDSGEVQTRVLRAHPPLAYHPQSLPCPLLPTRANAPPHPCSSTTRSKPCPAPGPSLS